MRIKILTLGGIFLILGMFALSQEEKKTKFLGEDDFVYMN